MKSYGLTVGLLLCVSLLGCASVPRVYQQPPAAYQIDGAGAPFWQTGGSLYLQSTITNAINASNCGKR